MAYELCKKSTLIAQQNDEFRRHLGDPAKTSIKGVVHLTRSVTSLPDHEQEELYADIAAFNLFREDNDSWGEHDYGRVTARSGDFYFKIDYFENSDFEYGSPDASDLDCTYRVMTIAAVEDY